MIKPITIIEAAGKQFPSDLECSPIEITGKNILRNVWSYLKTGQIKRDRICHQFDPAKYAHLYHLSSFISTLTGDYPSSQIEFLDAYTHSNLIGAYRLRDAKWELARPFQQVGVQFIEKALLLHEMNKSAGAIVGDEMGLGKTIQAALFMRYNKSKCKKICIVCPANLIYNWRRELKTWFCDRFNTIDDIPMIHVTDLPIIEDQNVHIISNAMISKPEVLKSICEYGFDLIIIDESHNFKNDDSSRTASIDAILKYIPKRIMLSGTSILNRTMEYYNSLHWARPNEWPSPKWLESYCAHAWTSKGKFVPLGIDQRLKDKFFDRTSSYVIRRRKKDVLKDLPEKNVTFEYINVANQKGFVKGYNKVLDELEYILNCTKSDAHQMTQLIGLMAKLRQIVGLAKTTPVLEEMCKFLEGRENGEKLAIGVHHKLVMEFLLRGIKEWIAVPPTQIASEDDAFLKSLGITSLENKSSEMTQDFRHIKVIHASAEQAHIKDARIKQFKEDENTAIAILSILGCGTGMNIQFCTNVINMERQWNRAIENQFEDRFHRIGTTEPVNIKYMLASDTIDEYFHDMVQLKGNISTSGLDGGEVISNNIMIELAERTVAKRMKYVG